MPAPANAAERRAHLRRVPFLAALDDAGLDAMLACVRWRAVPAGALLFREGDAGDAMVFVTEGELDVTVRHADGTAVTVARCAPGDTLGEMACLDPSPRAATVTARGASVVAELSRDGVGALEQAVPALASAVTAEVIRVVTRRMRELEARIDQELGVAVAPSEPPPPIDAPATPRRGGFLGFLDRLRGGA